uniref:Syntaxin N-terminal domain-containing protein n=1 Tax=Syphacia muris TaxID=451379 RepID=A0A0N5AZ87_9BILA
MLDEEMTNSEKITRSNLDNAKIDEKRVNWLLTFHKLQLQMRQVLAEASGAIYDDIDRILTLRHRGCSGVKLQKSTMKNLNDMKSNVDKTADFLRKQRLNDTKC